MRELLKACFRLILLLGFLRFLSVEAHHHHHHHHYHNHQKTRIRGGVILVVRKEASGSVKQDFVEGVDYVVKRKKHHRVVSKLELNYMNKRRVPNGPDPIHNRGAGKSHRPPGHA